MFMTTKFDPFGTEKQDKLGEMTLIPFSEIPVDNQVSILNPVNEEEAMDQLQMYQELKELVLNVNRNI